MMPLADTTSDDHIRALPKVELHVHVEGAAPPHTIAELARKNGVDLGVDDPADLYRYDDLTDFLRVFDLVCRSLQHAGDIHRVTYEALAIAAAAGVRYREMFFSPTFLLRHGVAFDTIWSGIGAGIADAATDHAIVCRMILDVDKPSGPSAATELVDAAARCDREVLIGIGGDAGERGIDLAAYAEPFQRARQLGFHTTMHLGEEGPADDIRTGIEIVGVERIDHGFSLLDDPDLVADVVESGVPFTVCPTSNRRIGLVDSVGAHPLIRMRDAGVRVTLNSDNAAMFGIDLADEYINVRDAFGCSLDELENFSLAAIDASWADDATKLAMRREFLTEMDDLRAAHRLESRELR
ncbi:MAG TPA: adenosine deaminase [Ilumatobacteraceae bacterium]|nr:adenosine deaminase [Ilumatobacteraceae bacterium]